MSDNHIGEQSLTSVDPPPVTVGRYVLHRQIARGGMATIHIARLMGDEGFSRIVAAKRLLPEFAEDSEFVAMFLDEARIASKVHHRNVVPVLDVVTTGEEAILVQEYVHGAPLHYLLRTARNQKLHIPLPIAVAIATQILAGLHAAHETSDELGVPLNIVHRDVSPQNIMIATDGTARLLDFGVAKATMAAHVTREGQFKGKLAYSAPEQLRGHATRQSDLYSLAVLLWELIVGHRMHQSAQAEVELVATIMNGKLPTVTEALASERAAIGMDRWRDLEAIEPIIKTGLAVDLKDRWATAADMEHALIDAVRPASLSEVSAWLKNLGREFLDKHDRVLAAEEASWRRSPGSPMATPVPGSIMMARTNSRQSVVSQLSTTAQGSGQAFQNDDRRRFGSNALIALLCGLVVALAIGVVFAVRGPGNTTTAQPAAQPPPPQPTAPALTPPPAPPMPTTTTAVAPPVPAAQPPPPAPTAAVKTDPKPEPIELQVGTPAPKADTPPKAQPAVTRKESPPPRRVQPPPKAQPQVQKTVKQPEKVETPAKAAGSDAKDKDDCNPPYYFEGQKKVFKPACI